MPSACACMGLITARESAMALERVLSQALMTWQPWMVTRDIGATEVDMILALWKQCTNKLNFVKMLISATKGCMGRGL